MKSSLLVFIGVLSLFAYSYSYSCSGGCSGSDDQSDCQQNSCVESTNTCQCADVNAGKNPCISKAEYCRVFGNVGDNKLPDF